eukprot:10958622-Lingulodinium_polyedra.AAC.1
MEFAAPVLRQLVCNIVMGAQWRVDALIHAGLVDDARCPFCRDAKDAFRHRWWGVQFLSTFAIGIQIWT